MNFTPFGGPFPGTIPNIHQFNSTGSLASSTPTIQDTNNRYHNSTINMTHFSQPLSAATSVPSKFRPEDINVDNKYNGHIVNSQQQYSSIPYSQPSAEDKRLIAAAITYPQSTAVTTSSSAPVQSQPQELTQDLCNALLQQQSVDTKRGELGSWQFEFLD